MNSYLLILFNNKTNKQFEVLVEGKSPQEVLRRQQKKYEKSGALNDCEFIDLVSL